MKRPISQKEYGKASLEDYQREIFDVWPQLANRPALHTWARVVKHGTAACEGMRRSDWPVVLEEIAKTIVWWLAFIKKVNFLSQASAEDGYDDDFAFALPISATEIVWRKYPGVCPVEFGLASRSIQDFSWDDRPGKICMCLARKKDVEERSTDEKLRAKETLRVFAQNQRSHCPKEIDALENMFRDIFAGPIYQLSIQELFFHLIEEVGEVSEALANATASESLASPHFRKRQLVNERKRKLQSIAEELADVFSWSVGIIAKVHALLVSFEKYLDARHEGTELQTIRKLLKGSQHISLSGAIWQRYGLKYNEIRCPDCGERPCRCSEQRATPLYSKALSPNQLRRLIKLFLQVSLD